MYEITGRFGTERIEDPMDANDKLQLELEETEEHGCPVEVKRYTDDGTLVSHVRYTRGFNGIERTSLLAK